MFCVHGTYFYRPNLISLYYQHSTSALVLEAPDIDTESLPHSTHNRQFNLHPRWRRRRGWIKIAAAQNTISTSPVGEGTGWGGWVFRGRTNDRPNFHHPRTQGEEGSRCCWYLSSSGENPPLVLLGWFRSVGEAMEFFLTCCFFIDRY